MTAGASTMAAAATVARAPPAVTMNRRRSLVTRSSSARNELMVGPLGDAVPLAQERLELRERRVHLSGHRRHLRLLPHGIGRQFLEIAQHRRREREDLDLALEFGLELSKRNRVLRLVVRMAIGVDRGGRVVERPPQIDRKRLVRLPVEAEFVRGAG